MLGPLGASGGVLGALRGVGAVRGIGVYWGLARIVGTQGPEGV